MIDRPDIGEIWYFFNGNHNGGGDYAIVTGLDPLPVGQRLEGSPLLKPTGETVTMLHGGFRYIRRNNTLANKIMGVANG